MVYNLCGEKNNFFLQVVFPRLARKIKSVPQNFFQEVQKGLLPGPKKFANLNLRAKFETNNRNVLFKSLSNTPSG